MVLLISVLVYSGIQTKIMINKEDVTTSYQVLHNDLAKNTTSHKLTDNNFKIGFVVSSETRFVPLEEFFQYVNFYANLEELTTDDDGTVNTVGTGLTLELCGDYMGDVAKDA